MLVVKTLAKEVETGLSPGAERAVRTAVPDSVAIGL
jgi:hypothetical protein